MPRFDFLVFAFSFLTIIIIILFYTFHTEHLALYLFETHKPRKHLFLFLIEIIKQIYSLFLGSLKHYFVRAIILILLESTLILILIKKGRDKPFFVETNIEYILTACYLTIIVVSFIIQVVVYSFFLKHGHLFCFFYLLLLIFVLTVRHQFLSLTPDIILLGYVFFFMFFQYVNRPLYFFLRAFTVIRKYFKQREFIKSVSWAYFVFFTSLINTYTCMTLLLPQIMLFSLKGHHYSLFLFLLIQILWYSILGSLLRWPSMKKINKQILNYYSRSACRSFIGNTGSKVIPDAALPCLTVLGAAILTDVYSTQKEAHNAGLAAVKAAELQGISNGKKLQRVYDCSFIKHVYIQETGPLYIATGLVKPMDFKEVEEVADAISSRREAEADAKTKALKQEKFDLYKIVLPPEKKD